MKKIIILIILCTSLFILQEAKAVSLELEYPTVGGETLTQQQVSDKDALINYTRYVYIFLLSIIAIAALGALVYGGFVYMLSDTVFAKDSGKKWIWGAVSGLIIALASYLILYTINSELVSLKSPSKPVSSASGSTPGTGTQAPGTGTQTPGTGTQTPGTGTQTPGTGTQTPGGSTGTMSAQEQAIRDDLAQEQITAYRPPCPSTCTQTSIQNCKGCVNLAGLRQTSIDGIKAIRQYCPTCELLITGGTEWGHSSNSTYNHMNGYKLDINSNNNPNLNWFVSKFSGDPGYLQNPDDVISGYDAYYFRVPKTGVSNPDPNNTADWTYVQALNEKHNNHWDFLFTDDPITPIQKSKTYPPPQTV